MLLTKDGKGFYVIHSSETNKALKMVKNTSDENNREKEKC